MCYAIPGKVIEFNDNIVTVDYFGEKKKARNEFYELKVGDYIYAQGGFIIQKIPQDEALEILDTCQEYFYKLKEIDLRLAYQPQARCQIANSIRQKNLGNSCCVHGIIEFSNICRNNCLYCGLRKDNNKLTRYRMGLDEIIETCEFAVNKLGFKAIVLQSGEDLWYTQEKLIFLVSQIRQKSPCLLILSVGERESSLYEGLYQAGARAVLLRFETSNPQLYPYFRPGHLLEERLDLIRKLGQIGYLVFTGFLIGLPQQTEQDILADIELTASLGAEMFSFGPFLPHPDTPLAGASRPSLDLVLTTIAQARILCPEAKILVTTALETLDKENGARLGLLSGANSLMINVTPKKYQNLYQLYPNRAGTEQEVTERIKEVLNLLYSLGRAPTDLGL